MLWVFIFFFCGVFHWPCNIHGLSLLLHSQTLYIWFCVLLKLFFVLVRFMYFPFTFQNEMFNCFSLVFHFHLVHITSFFICNILLRVNIFRFIFCLISVCFILAHISTWRLNYLLVVLLVFHNYFHIFPGFIFSPFVHHILLVCSRDLQF